MLLQLDKIVHDIFHTTIYSIGSECCTLFTLNSIFGAEGGSVGS